MFAKDLKVGDTILVARTNPNAKHALDRIGVKPDPNGFPVRVTDVREKALVGRGMTVQLSQGVFSRIMPDDEVYPAN